MFRQLSVSFKGWDAIPKDPICQFVSLKHPSALYGLVIEYKFYTAMFGVAVNAEVFRRRKRNRTKLKTSFSQHWLWRYKQ